MSKAYFFNKGIDELAGRMNGNENIFLGIRPYGFHAGNKIPFIIYPLLLCEKYQEKQNKLPRFTFYVFLNDWEQDGFDQTYTDIKTHPFNVIPKFTTFQYTLYENGGGCIVDFWESKIIDDMQIIIEKFPTLNLRFIRNSYMRDNSITKDVVLKTINNPDLVGNVLRETTGREILPFPYSYCRPICPKCKSAKTEATVNGENIHIVCKNCDLDKNYNYYSLNYWLYHKPLALPRIAIYKIDLCITGIDHYNEGDFNSRQKLFKVYNIKCKNPDMLYTPTLYGKNNLPMGKSKGNYEDVEINSLYELVENNLDKEKIYLK